MLRRLITLFLPFLLMTSRSHAQARENNTVKNSKDSLLKQAFADYAIRYPGIRPVHFSTDVIGRGDLHSDLYGNRLLDGRIRTVRSSVNIHFPVAGWKNNALSGSLNYTQQHISVSQISPNPLVRGDFKNTKGTLSFTLNYRRTDSLFSRPVTYSAAVTGATNSASSIQHLSYLGMIVFPLKRTPATSVQIGAEFMIDPSVRLPVLPLIAYWHRFSDPRWELSADLPVRLKLRNALGKNLWANFNSELSGSVAFYRFSNSYLPQDVSYTTLDLRSGPGIEYRYHQLMLGISGGLYQPVSSRLFQRNSSSGDYFIKNRNGAAPYLNVSLSLLSF